MPHFFLKIYFPLAGRHWNYIICANGCVCFLAIMIRRWRIAPNMFRQQDAGTRRTPAFLVALAVYRKKRNDGHVLHHSQRKDYVRFLGPWFLSSSACEIQG